MVVNVDVSNAVFWYEQSLMNAAREVTGYGSYAEVANKSKPYKPTISSPMQEGPAMAQLRKLKKNEIVVKHPGRTQKESKSFALLPRILQRSILSLYRCIHYVGD